MLSPMRATLTTVGSYGDVIPFVAIAEALRERDHHVRFCSWRHLERLFTERNIGFTPVGGELDLHGYSREVIGASMSSPNPDLMLESAFELFIAF